MRRCYWVLPWLVFQHGIVNADPATAPAAAQAGEAAPQAGTGVVEAAPASPAETPTFDVYDFQIDGNSVLDRESVEKTVYPYLGPGKRIEDMESARKALEKLYRDRGYATVVVDIPEQDVKGGRVRLQVVEGRVEYFGITGSRYFSQDKIRAGIPALAEGQVPHMPTVQKQMTELAKESSDRTVTPVFRAGSTPGKTEVEMKVNDQLPVHGGIEINGRNTEHTTRLRLISSLRYDNLWQKFHSASIQYQVSPQNSDEVQVWSGTYVLPTGFEDTRLALYGIGINSNTELGTTVGGTSVVGTGEIFGFRLVKPLEPRDQYFQSLLFGFDYKMFDQSVALVGQDTGNTPINYAPFTFGYEGTLRSDSHVSSASLAGHLSIRGLGDNAQEFENKRANAKPNYFYFTADLKHQQLLPYDFQFVGRASGQITDGPLISNEQYAAGGMQSVRGYYQTQQLGDDGVNLSAELQTPMLFRGTWEGIDYFRVLTFFDWAYLWIIDPLPGNPAFYQLAGTGMGLRAQVYKHFIGELDWGYPFYAQGTVQPGNNRVDFRLVYEF